MANLKSQFVCQQCGDIAPKWQGQCASCEAWNSLVETTVNKKPNNRRDGGYAGIQEKATITSLSGVSLTHYQRLETGFPELDRVLGGGLVSGSVVLVGGDPGIGKSTLLLQTLCHLSLTQAVLYVTGEESLQQVAMRAERLQVNREQLNLLTETCIERIITLAQDLQPKVMVLDSIQTLYTDAISATPGSISQVRESAAQLLRYAKQTETTLLLVGHVTKEGALAGPRVLEHMVDTVLYFEGEKDNRYRVVRSIKNRFGAVNELGVFGMTDKGLRSISNPSAIFLSGYKCVPGSAVTVIREGSRPLLVEVQALVDDCHGGPARRICVGLDQSRLSMLLAILHKHGQLATYDQDIFLNVVGGVKVTETGTDLAILCTIVSSLRNRCLPEGLILFGELGLAGEIRPVPHGQERLREAAKHGFTQAIVPSANLSKKNLADLKTHPVSTLSEALDIVMELS